MMCRQVAATTYLQISALPTPAPAQPTMAPPHLGPEQMVSTCAARALEEWEMHPRLTLQLNVADLQVRQLPGHLHVQKAADLLSASCKQSMMQMEYNCRSAFGTMREDVGRDPAH